MDSSWFLIQETVITDLCLHSWSWYLHSREEILKPERRSRCLRPLLLRSRSLISLLAIFSVSSISTSALLSRITAIIGSSWVLSFYYNQVLLHIASAYSITNWSKSCYKLKCKRCCHKERRLLQSATEENTPANKGRCETNFKFWMKRGVYRLKRVRCSDLLSSFLLINFENVSF